MNISIRHEPFNNIANNLKLIEVRLFRGIFTKIKKDDVLIFKSRGKILKKKVKDIKLYNSFEELYNLENVRDITPTINSKKEFIRHYKNIYKNFKVINCKVIALFI
jgi:ASC-1-like (ASCH) protein